MATRILGSLIMIILAGAILPQASQAKNLVLDGHDGLYVTRTINEYGAGSDDVLIVHMNLNNYDGWVRTWGRPARETLGEAASDGSGNLLVCGHYSIIPYEEYVAQPGFILKFNTAGDLIWARDIGWSDWSVMLEDVAADAAGNVYATGTAWRYEDPPQAEGWHAVYGVIFTVKLDSAGEVVWAKRWSHDARDLPTGREILTDGNEVVVAGYYNSSVTNDSETVMLWYSAADGSLTTSQAWGASDMFVRPFGMEYGPNGSVYVLCWNSGDTDVILLKYSNGRVLQFAQAWGNKDQNTGIDLSTAENRVFICGSQQVGSGTPDDTGYSAPILNGLLLEFTDDVLTGQRTCWDAASIEDTVFTSLAARTIDDVWVTGKGPVKPNLTFYEEAEGVAWRAAGTVAYPAALEDMSCAGNSFEAENATLTTPMSLLDFADYCYYRRIFLSSLEWYKPPHTPDTRITADDTSGPAPFTVNFDASNTTVPYGSITNYSWDFNIDDGLQYDVDSGLDTSAQFTFTEPGTYIVVVQATADDGAKMPATIQIRVT